MLKENHILPFLWLHGEDEATLRDMLQKIHQSNIGAVCLESRPHPDFAGDTWWRDLDIILDEAVKLGLKVWILDDSHFPTGFANGKVIDADEKLCKQYVYCARVDCAGPIPGATLDVVSLTKPKPNPFAAASPFRRREPRKFDDEEIIGVAAYPVTGYEKLGRNAVDLTDKVKDGVLSWDVPAGAWRIVVTYLTRNGGGDTAYVNLLHAESVDLLINEVYEKHYAHYAKYFGNTILGFFSDEPAVGNCIGFSFDERIGHKDMPLPWAPEMPGMLGDDFRMWAPFLWFDGDDEKCTASCRLAYMDACTKLISKNFSDRLGKWCEAHGVMYIGHVIEDNNQHMRLGSSCGHFFRAMSGMHMAGIDDIGGQVIPGLQDIQRNNFSKGDGEFYHFTLAKLGASLAQVDANKEGRTMCEIFGAYGWQEGVREMKWLANHFIVNGVNNYVPHAFTGKEFPDPDCPPHFYAHGHNPQFRHFGELMKYMNRLCDLFSRGRPETDCTILYPAEAYWMGDAMLPQKPARVLHESQRDFLFWPMDKIDSVPKFPLIIPACDYLPQPVIEWCNKNYDKVIYVDKRPDGAVGGTLWPLKKLPELVSRHLPMEGAGKGIRYYHYHGDEEAFMFFNEGFEANELKVKLPKGAFYDADKDVFIKAETDESGKAVFALEPGEACVYVTDKKANYKKVSGKKTELKPELVGYATAESYPKFGELPCAEDEFSGTMAYECAYKSSKAGKARVLVGDCTEAVEVFVDGVSQGFSIAPPYGVDVELPKGDCVIRIEVTSTLGNQQHAYSGGHFSSAMIRPRNGLTGKVEIMR